MPKAPRPIELKREMEAQKKREKALFGAIGRAQGVAGMRDYQTASLLEIHPSTFSAYKHNAFQSIGFWDFARMARKLEFTPKELCDMVGIPYE